MFASVNVFWSKSELLGTMHVKSPWRLVWMVCQRRAVVASRRLWALCTCVLAIVSLSLGVVGAV